MQEVQLVDILEVYDCSTVVNSKLVVFGILYLTSRSQHMEVDFHIYF